MIVHQIEALRDAGVDEVVLAINYQPQVMYAFIEEYQAKLGVKISISQVCLWHAQACPRLQSPSTGTNRVSPLPHFWRLL